MGMAEPPWAGDTPRWVPLQWQGDLSPNLVVLLLFLWREGDRVVRFFCPALPEGLWILRAGTGGSILLCWDGGRREQAMVSPWDIFFFSVVDQSDFIVVCSLCGLYPPNPIRSYENWVRLLEKEVVPRQ